MKFKRITQEQAETIIVYGKGDGFSIVNLADKDYTIYHRIYNNKYYDVAEADYSDYSKGDGLKVFYLFDPEEVKQILGVDPRKVIEEDLMREVVEDG